MSVAFLDMSVEVKKGGYISQNWIMSHKYSYLMSGISIISKGHLVSTRNLHCLVFHHIPHLVSTMIKVSGLSWGHDMHDDGLGKWANDVAQ